MTYIITILALLAISLTSPSLSGCDLRPSEFCSSSIAMAMNSSQTLLFLGLSPKVLGEVKPIAALLTMTELAENPAGCSEGEVEISGFAYQNEQGVWVLSAEPNLKSCCAAAKGKRERQVILKGKLDQLLPASIVKMKGTLKKESEGFVLEDSEIVEQTPGGFWQFRWK